jgi:hypothetical protein
VVPMHWINRFGPKKKSKIVNHNNFEALNVFLAEAAENGNDNVLSQASINKSAEL